MHRGFGAAVMLAIVIALLGAGTSSAAPPSSWQASWAAAMTGAEPVGSSHDGFSDQSLRMIVHTSVGGDMVRVRFSNLFGQQALPIGHATVALPNPQTSTLTDVDPTSIHELTFGGRTTTSIPAGQKAHSDPVAMTVAPLSDLVVTVYFPTPTGPTTWHVTSNTSEFVGSGDVTTSTNGPFTLQRNCCWYYLSGVDVRNASPTSRSVVVLGDSISDGNGSTLNANQTWPQLLAKRLIESDKRSVPAVLNASLSGNRLNHEGPEPGAGGFPGFVQLGQNALTRMGEDVFGQLNVKTVILQEGVDDIWMSDDSADAITATMRAIAAEVHAHDARILVSTITPYHGFEAFWSDAWTQEKEATRQAVNAYLRSSGAFDGLLDFDRLLRNPADATRLRPEFDSGDHLDPNDLGAQQMANFVRLSLLG